MSLNQLKEEVDKKLKKGWGKKEVILSVGDGIEYDIDSISTQQNNHADYEAEYLLIMT